ncbi:MAG: hypothetical protein QNJ90_12025 [Planctomycetota bacterium]|nr:hypothetical protein [Planctomycetota bacterium]
MSPEPVKIDILGLNLVVRGTPSEGFRARGVFRGHGAELAFAHLVDIETREVEDLLRQIERQYGDFSRKVHWWTEDGMVDLRWTLDERGHLRGRIRLVDARWEFETELQADQSYLPKLALGLRLLLRA